MRAKYQVLVLPWRKTQGSIQYCIFKRGDSGCWQFIAGGGESEDRSVLEAARREAWEEAAISPSESFVPLESQCSISAEHFAARAQWGPETLVIPEYAFGVEVTRGDMEISREHSTHQWVSYATARTLLKFDSNRVALWELDQKLRQGTLGQNPEPAGCAFNSPPKALEPALLGKCGFYCGACPTYLAGNCLGCMAEHKEGDCFTKDCAERRGLGFCGACGEFPCDALLTRPKTTVLDKDWLRWKRQSNSNR